MRVSLASRLIVSTLALVSLSGTAIALRPSAPAPAVLAAPAALADTVALIEIEGALHEQPSPLAWLMGNEGHVTLSDAVTAIHRVATTDKYAGLVIRLKDAEISRTHTEELGAAIKAVRAAGKKVHVFSEAYGTAELLLASYADEVLAMPGAPVMLTGMHAEEMFLADTLAWAGLKAEFVQVGDYKGANEMMVNSKPSPAWDQNINQLMDSMYGNMRSTFKANRNLDDAKLDQAFSDLWLADSEDAQKSGLADGPLDYPELVTHLDKKYGREMNLDDSLLASKSDEMDVGNPFALLTKLSQKPDTTPKGPTIAVLHIDGAIVDGDSTSGGLMGGEGSVGSRTIRRMIEELIEEDLIKGVVLRINSPGGSATASEVIYQGLKKLSAKKPVWVSVGSMAASGGYYAAVGGQKIYVNPSSIVGSIGVVGGRVSMDGLYKMLKVNVVDRSRGPRSEMFRSTSPWTPEEIATVRRKMTETYDQFTSRVTAGRPGIDLGKTAEGRLFTGEKAVALKMADKIGGLDEAVRDLATEVGVTDPDVMHFPGPKSIPEMIEDTFGGMVQGPSVKLPGASPLAGINAAGQELFGDAWIQVRQGMQATLQLRKEPVLLMTPSVIMVK
ncbi:MAG: signal peptide peptidase SppA [Tepidisphaera sp.]